MEESVRPKIVISDDTMAAFVILPHGPDYTVDDLRNALRAEGVTHGVSVRALVEAVEGPRGIIYQVAWGTMEGTPQEEDAREPEIVFNFPQPAERPVSEYPVDPDFKERGQAMLALDTVREGDVLCVAKGNDERQRGTGVTGLPVLLGPEPPALATSENTCLSADGKSLLARRPGIPYVENGVVYVMDHVVIQGNVDKETGNLEFVGDITVQGSISPGYRVSAGQNLIVEGSILGSASAGGQIAVKGGISAPGETVESGGGVLCKFIENSLVRTMGPVKVAEAILHSVVEAEGSIKVTDPGGRIVGGRIRARKGVYVDTVGTDMDAPTVIEVGVSPKYRREFSTLEKDLQRVQEELKNANKSKYSSGFNQYDRLRVKRLILFLETQEKELYGKLRALRENMRRLGSGYFRAQTIFPGTRLVMGVNVTDFKSRVEGYMVGVIRD